LIILIILEEEYKLWSSPIISGYFYFLRVNPTNWPWSPSKSLHNRIHDHVSTSSAALSECNSCARPSCNNSSSSQVYTLHADMLLSRGLAIAGLFAPEIFVLTFYSACLTYDSFCNVIKGSVL
jgi:hypothetical protein